MKTILSFLITAFMFILLFNNNMSGQEVIIKSQTGEKKLNTDKNTRTALHESFSKQTTQTSFSGLRQNSYGWKLSEDFESAVFPPDEWSAYNGWQQTGYSSYGNGNYSASFCNFCCLQVYNELRTPYFTLTENGDILSFDVAYAPRGDSNSNVTDYLIINYWNDSTFLWEYLTTFDKDSLSTAPPTNSAFYPAGTQWKTISVSLPVNASQIYFYSYEMCGNNIYLDNIKVGQPPPVNQYLLSENFSGSFPPDNWNTGNFWIYNSASAYGIGTGSVMRELINCTSIANDFLTTPEFPSAAQGTRLMFDYAYAPYDYSSFDNLQIYGTSDGGMNFDLITTMSGDPNGGELVTAPPNYGNYFIPENSMWRSKMTDIPAGTTQLKFAVDNDCSNNLYLDNITVQDSAFINYYDAAVTAVFTKSKIPLAYGTPDTVSSVILNNSGDPVSLKVYLDISGVNIYKDSVMISVLPGEYKTVRFNPYTYFSFGSSDITVYVKNDLDNSNNHKTVTQLANSDTYRYSDSSDYYSGINYTQTGSFLNKYRINGEGLVTKVRVQVYNSALVAGQMYYGVVLDASGNLVGRSNDYILKSSDANTLLTFNITDPKPYLLNNSDFYAGIVQTQNIGEWNTPVTSINYYSDDYQVLRRNANYYGYVGALGTNLNPYEQNDSPFDFAIEAVTEPRYYADVGIADAGLKYDQYFSSNTFTPESKVFNAGLSNATFTVTRIHALGGYSSTKTVSNLAPGSTATVVFDPWTFPATNIEQPVFIYTNLSDGNSSNNFMYSTITPRVAKDLCVLWQSETDRDSLVRAINSDGRFADNFDTVRINYTGSLRPWKNVYCLLKNGADYTPWLRDSMKTFLDNSTSFNKKSLLFFSDYLSENDQLGLFKTPADTVFYRQYLKAKAITYNWTDIVPASGKRFKGIGIFEGIKQDSLHEGNMSVKPGLIKAVNGGTAAFKPKSVNTSGNDSCNAVCFNGSSRNTFYITNRYSDLRYSQSNSPQVSIFSRTIDWIENINSSFTLNLTGIAEGFYFAGTNTMTPDTMRVYLRNSSFPFTIVDSGKAMLNSSGEGIFTFSNIANNTGYFIQLKHRNSVETWSSSPQSFINGTLSFSFVTSASQAYGSNLVQVNSLPARYAVYSGDVNQDGTIDAGDLSQVENDAANSLTGYEQSDVTGDDYVDAGDLSIVENNAASGITAVTP